MPTPRKSPARALTPTRQSRRLRGEAPAPLDFSDPPAESTEKSEQNEQKDVQQQEEEQKQADAVRSPPRKETLEDRFFKLKEMENFLDEQDRNPNISHGILTEFDDDVGDADYKYEEFFGTSTAQKPLEEDEGDDQEEAEEIPPVPLDTASTSTAEEAEEQVALIEETEDVQIEGRSEEKAEDEQPEEVDEKQATIEEVEEEVEREEEQEAEKEQPPTKRVRFSIDAEEKRELEADAKKIEKELENLPPMDFDEEVEDEDFDLPDETTLLEEEEQMDVDGDEQTEEQQKEEEEEEETTFSKQQKNLRSTIAQLEQQNLEPRSWELAGEVAAADREPDALLSQYLDVDYRATQPPVITEDVNSRIEAIVKQRIKDKNFDDVIRVKRVDESLQTFRARTNIDEIERKSLMEMYEKQYAEKKKAVQQIADDDETEEQLDPQSAAIQSEMRAVFDRLDELSHANYRPAEAVGEPEVIVNKLALNLEEVGQKASAAPDEELLAPEEVAKHQRAAPKSKEERDRTDKNRERRKKKKKQKILVQKGVKKEGEYKAETQLEERAPEKKMKKRRTKVIKSNGMSLKLDKKDFYAQLQATNEREQAEKTTKAKKLKRERSTGIKSGAQYKL